MHLVWRHIPLLPDVIVEAEEMSRGSPGVRGGEGRGKEGMDGLPCPHTEGAFLLALVSLR